MRYRVQSSEGRRLVLRLSMPERPLITLFLAVVAFVCLLLALVYALSAESPGDPFRALFFTGFGLFCFSGIFLFSGAFRRAFPHGLVFDNELGRLDLLGRAGDSIGSIPYEGIAGFSVARTMEDRVTRYSAGIDLVRGGRWELYSSQSRGRAEAFLEAMRPRVTLTARGSSPAAGLSPADRLSPDRSEPGVLRVAWIRKSRPVSLVVSLVVLVSFVAALVGTRPFAGSPGAWIAAVAFGAFFLLAALVSILRTIGERMEVRVGRGMLEHRRTSALSRPKGFSIKLSHVASVDFSMTFSRIGTRIVVLEAGQVERFVRYRQGTFSPVEAPGLIPFLRGLRRIDVSALEPERKLALAELIRESVQSSSLK